MTELIQFDLGDIPENASICLVGKRRSGKNVLAKDLCYNFYRGKVKNVFLFSPTAEIALNSYNFVPMEYRYSYVDVDVINRIMKRQEYLIKNNPKGNHKILLLFDDIAYSNNFQQKQIIDKLFICARHFQISLICNFQYLKTDLTRSIKDNTDLIFVFNQSNIDNKKIINEQFLSVDEDKKKGLELINKYAIQYQTLTILNTMNTNDFSDFCFYYTADEINRSFKLGKEYDLD